MKGWYEVKFEEYKIDLPEAVLEIFAVVKKYGADAYVVGGCVRDSIMGRNPHDWDICTPVLAAELQAIFVEKGYRVIPTGLQHGTITVVINGEGYEITQFRRDGEYSDGRHPDNVEFTSNLIEDLERRDFTVNAMAYNPDIGLIDPFGGMQDIKEHVIRCVGNPHDRFSEDALRILRALRFRCQFDNFHINRDTIYAMFNRIGLLEKISKERIRDEFLKAFENTFRFADCMDIFSFLWYKIFPEFEDMWIPQHNPYHIYSVQNHTLVALQIAAQLNMDIITKLAVFFHDIGKPHSYQDGEDGIRHFKGHGRVSADMTDSIMRRLRFDNDTRKKVVELVYYHDATFEIGAKYVKRWLNKIGEKQFRRLLDLRKADIRAQNPVYEEERLEKVADIEVVLENVLIGRQCFTMGDLAVNGDDVMRTMGIKEGKDVGRWLKEILNRVIDGRLKNDRDELIYWMTGITDGWIEF